jgi:hypothetical protein
MPAAPAWFLRPSLAFTTCGQEPNGLKLSSTTQPINESRAYRCQRVAGSWIEPVFDGAGSDMGRSR